MRELRKFGDRLRIPQFAKKGNSLLRDSGNWGIRSLSPNFLLILLLAAEIWAFSGAFDKFFNHDSIFYLIHAPKSWGEFAQFLTAPDDARQYRPLTLWIMGIIVPWLGTDPRPYHAIPVLFHVVNTLLFFVLMRRLLPGRIGALCATAFWGMHSVAGWITFDITYLSDFLLATLCLGLLLLAVEGTLRGCRWLLLASFLLFIPALLTKEAAVTIPLALWLCVALTHMKADQAPPTLRTIRLALKKAAPLAAGFLAISLAYAALLLHWLRSGLLYTQGANAAYDIDLLSNLAAKTKYLYWGLNLPDTLHIPNAERIWLIAVTLTGVLIAAAAFEILRRRGKLSPAEWSGLVWFVGLNLPALLLSSRLAKWYLYVPLMGLALTFGSLMDTLRSRFLPQRVLAPIVWILVCAPLVFSTVYQTRDYWISSDSAYASNVLESCLEDFRGSYPALPEEFTVFMLPSFEKNITELLSAPPIGEGQLFQLFYPGTKIRYLFAHRGDRMPDLSADRTDAVVLLHLDGRFHDVTRYFQRTGRMSIYLFPTFEGEVPELLKREPTGGRKLFERHVTLLLGDEGTRLPVDYASREDLWLLQYINGHFTDVTDYYRGRHRDSSRRLIPDIDAIRASVSRDEYYPDYTRFHTPSGGPVFHPTPGKEIVTQIGGSSAVLPPVTIPSGASLLFDISWMYDRGDGGWAEVRIRSAGEEVVLHREYMQPNPVGRGLRWKQVKLDLQRFAGRTAELILRCYNDAGKNTVSDWLNWRDIVLQTP